jgi:hypothetical protein
VHLKFLKKTQKKIIYSINKMSSRGKKSPSPRSSGPYGIARMMKTPRSSMGLRKMYKSPAKKRGGLGCSKKRLQDCRRKFGCKWYINKGCRNRYSKAKKSPKSPKAKRQALGCAKKKKSPCLKSPMCTYYVGKGCRNKPAGM